MAVLLAAGLLGVPAAADPWSGFRGPRLSGRLETGLPVYRRGEPIALKTVWKRPIGAGYSSVAVAGDCLVTQFADGDREWLGAFHAEDGRGLWRVDMGRVYEGHDGSFTGPVATPWIEDGRVFALGAHGRLAAAELDSGDLLWSVELTALGAREPDYGFGTAPTVIGGTLVVMPGAGGTMSGFDPATGRLRWTAGSDPVAYQHAVPWRMGGADAILAAGDVHVFAVDPTDGRLLRQAPHHGAEAMGAYSLVPVVMSTNRILLTHHRDASKVWQWAGPAPTVAWESGGLSKSYAVPVLQDGYLFGYHGLFLTCVDGATGETRWQTRSPGDGFLVAVDERLLALTKRGSLHVLEADPDSYREAAGTDVLQPPVWSQPAVSGNRIFVRGMKEWSRVDVVAADDGPGRGRTAADEDSILARLRAAAGAGTLDAFLADAPATPWIESSNTVHFVYRGPAEEVAVGGDMIGTRQMLPMQRIAGSDCFVCTMQIAPDARCNYAFSVDGAHTTDPRNPRTTVSRWYLPEMNIGDGERPVPFSWFAMPAWDPPAYLEAPPLNRGRVVQVDLPGTNPSRTYPLRVFVPRVMEGPEPVGLAVVHGGYAALDYGDWEHALQALPPNQVGPVVAVFLPRETLSLQPASYAKLVCEIVIPWALETYPAIGGPDRRAHIGMGLTGTSALYCAFLYPDLARRLGTQSIILLDKTERELVDLLQRTDVSGWTVYMDWGRYDLRNTVEAWDMGEKNRQWDARCRDAGAHLYGGEAADGTDWSSWRNRTGPLLQALFPPPAP